VLASFQNVWSEVYQTKLEIIEPCKGALERSQTLWYPTPALLEEHSAPVNDL